MEKFLKHNPQFIKQAETLQQIKKKVLFKNISDLNSYLTVFKVPLFKELIKKDFYSSKELKETYSKIVKKENNDVEKMIFQLLRNKEIHFKNFELHAVFYKEFPEFIHLFIADGTYEMEDYLFKKIYLRIDVDDLIQRKIEKSPFIEQIFFIVLLHSQLNHNFIKNRLLDIKNEQKVIMAKEEISEIDFIKNWIIGLRCLPSEEFYTISASELLYSPYLDKINFYRGLADFVNNEKLSIFMLKTCFSNPLSVVKTYIVFLKLIELFNLRYEFKLKLLYSWLRFFILENYLDLFYDLMKNLKKSKKLDDEFDIYLQIEKFLLGFISYDKLKLIIDKFNDTENISGIKIDQICEKLKTTSK